MIGNLFYAYDKDQKQAEEIAQQLGVKALNAPSQPNQPFLELADEGLIFFHPEARSKNKFSIDFNTGAMGWRLKRADHEQLIKKALGKSEKPLNILDCTAGLLQDSLLFLSLGHQVTAVEQSNILFHLLKDGINRVANKELFSKLSLLQGNACSFSLNAKDFDVIYFDPMYPSSKKTALGSGQLDYLSKILETESIQNNPQEDFKVLKLIPAKKMIVKRPIKAESFATGINYQVLGKTTRFDIYI